MKTTVIRQTPGEVVAQLRHRRQLTLQELGDKAKIPFSYVWAIEQGKRRPGPRVARQLAVALNMTAPQRDAFLLLVAEHAKRERATPKARDQPQVLLNVLAEILAQHLGKRTVKTCYTGLKTEADDGQPDLVIECSDGSRLGVDLKFSRV